MPTARYGAAAAADHGLIWVVGGRTDAGVLNVVEGFNTASGEWYALPPMPTPRSRLAAVFAGGRLFAIGGTDGKKPLATVEAFDFQTQTWSRLQPLRHPRSRLAGAAFGGSLFVFGGTDDGKTPLDYVERYDLSAGGWTDVPQMTLPLADATAHGYGDLIFLIGGLHLEDGRLVPAADVEAFDPVELGWKTLAPLNQPRVAPGVTGELWVYGGGQDGGQLEPEVYKERDDVWVPASGLEAYEATPAPVYQREGSAVKVYKIAVKRRRDGSSYVMPPYDPPSPRPGGKRVPDFPESVDGAVYIVERDAFSFGGYSRTRKKALALVQRFSLAGKPPLRSEEDPPAAAPLAASEPPPAPATDFAVVVGTGPFGKEDAEAVAASLERHLGFPKKNVVLLEGDKASQDELFKALNPPFRSRLTANNRFVFYFSGYGGGMSGNFPTVRLASPRSDFSAFIPLATIWQQIGAMPVRKLIVLDAGFAVGASKSLADPGYPADLPLKQGLRDEKTTLLSAADIREGAAVLPEKRHGLLTYFFLKALAEVPQDPFPAGDFNEIGAQIRDDAAEEARKRGMRQTPRFFRGKGEFPLH